VYPPYKKLCKILKKMMIILVEVIGSAILSPVLLGSSPANKTHNKEAHYFHLV
jgi:hypothetical protein